MSEPRDVFISYSSKDEEITQRIYTFLEKNGIRCWISSRHIEAGANYGSSIIDAINNCRIFLMIFSESSNASQQVLREVERSVSKGLKMVPVRIDNTLPSYGMEYFISTTQWIDAFPGNIDEHINKILRQVEVLLIKDIDKQGRFSSKEEKNYLAFQLGKELSLFVLYGEDRTLGRIWMLREFNRLGIYNDKLNNFLKSMPKEQRIINFDNEYIIIRDDLLRIHGMSTSIWFDLGLSLTSILALLLADEIPDKKKEMIKPLITSSNYCIGKLELRSLIDLTPLQQWINQTEPVESNIQELIEHVIEQVRMVQTRFGK